MEAEDERSFLLLRKHGVTARALAWRHSLRLREGVRAPQTLFTVGGVVVDGEIERNETDLGAAIP